MKIGQTVQRWRKEKKQIPKSTIASPESGVALQGEHSTSFPDAIVVCALADYFGVTADELPGRDIGKTFAVCDDAPFIRKSIKDIMEEDGFLCVGLAENWTELSKLFEKKIPELLFLDIHYPEENGLDMLKKIKEKYPATKVIMITADKTEETKQLAFRYGADEWISKPFLPEQIVTCAVKETENEK